MEREVVPSFEPSTEAPAREAGAGTGLDPMGGVKGKRPSEKDKLRAAAAAEAAPAAPSKRPKAR